MTERNEAEAHRKAWLTRHRAGEGSSAVQTSGDWGNSASARLVEQLMLEAPARRQPPVSEGKGKWFAGGHFKVADTPEGREWAKTHEARTGHAPVPFPKATKDQLEKASSFLRNTAIKMPGERVISVASLVATQDTVTLINKGGVQDKLRERRPAAIVVVRLKDGSHVIWDGHHRATAAYLKGRKNIKALVYQDPTEGR